MMQIEVTTEPALLVSVQEAQDFLKLDDSYPELSLLIRSVQEKAEVYTGRSFTQRTVQLVLDEIPALFIELPREPVISITSIKTLDESGTETVVSSSAYYLADNHRLVFTTVPDVQRDYGGVVIEYVAGDKDKTPDAMKSGILKALATAFEMREDYVVGASVSMLPDDSKTYFNTWRLIKAC